MLLEIALRLAGAVAGLIAVLLAVKLAQKRPCWLVGCSRRMKHLSIEKRLWEGGRCPRNDPSFVPSYRHPAHLLGSKVLLCFVTKWVCRDCGKMGFFCVGDEHHGAWTILNGEIVPDEKHWAQWTDGGKGV